MYIKLLKSPALKWANKSLGHIVKHSIITDSSRLLCSFGKGLIKFKSQLVPNKVSRYGSPNNQRLNIVEC